MDFDEDRGAIERPEYVDKLSAVLVELRDPEEPSTVRDLNGTGG
jgi:hypothetical protein